MERLTIYTFETSKRFHGWGELAYGESRIYDSLPAAHLVTDRQMGPGFASSETTSEKICTSAGRQCVLIRQSPFPYRPSINLCRLGSDLGNWLIYRYLPLKCRSIMALNQQFCVGFGKQHAVRVPLNPAWSLTLKYTSAFRNQVRGRQ